MAQRAFYPSHCWVPQGCFELIPKRAELNANYGEMIKQEANKARGDLQAARAAAAAASSAAPEDDAEAARIERDYSLQDYDDDDGGAEDGGNGVDAEIDDEELAADEGDIGGVEGSDSDEDEDMKLEATDNLVVVAQVRPAESVSEAQVHVYSEPNKQFYEHRSFYLDSMPLCFDWIGRGRLLAVGRMEPQVQLWDLDLLEALVPQAQLEGHSDAVLDVSWNPASPQALATASADKRVGLWDVDSRRCVRLVSGLHSDKAQSLAWHPQEPHLLLSGGYDGAVRLTDCRAPSSAAAAAWKLDGECERLAWDRRNPLFLLAATERGSVQRCDARMAKGAPVSTLAAHAGACCGLAITEHGLLCTGGADGQVRLWRANQNGDWKLLAARDWGIGDVTKLTPNPNCQCVLAITGMDGFQVWDVRENAEVRNYLSSRGVQIPDA